MSEASCLAQRSDPHPAASPYYVWEAPGKPVSVRISLQVVDRLDRAAVETFRSISSRGSEIGGLLFGSVIPGTPVVVSIDDYEPISCDYSRGPLFHLSDADGGRLQTVLSRCAKDGVRVVGFFRSHTRKGLSLDAEDLALMESHFRDSQAVALLVRPFATKPSMGGIFIREDGQTPGEASCLEFPFQSALLPASLVAPTPSSAPRTVAPEPPPPAPAKPARGQVVPMTSRLRVALPVPPAPQSMVSEAPPPAPPEKPAPPVAVVVEAPRAEAPVPAEPAETPALEDAPEPLAPRRARVPWVWGAVAAALVACSGMLFVYPGVLRHHGGRPVVPLALRVEHSAGDLLLTWNRDSDAIRNARKGMLTITDGDRSENTAIDPQVGSIMYTPVTADVSFHLEVTGADNSKTTSESVRVLRTRPSPMPSETGKPAPAKADAAAADASHAPGAAAALGGDAAAAAEPEPSPTKLATASRPFVAAPLVQRLRPALASDLPDAPGVDSVPAASINLGAIVPIQTALPVSASRETRAPAASAPAQASQLHPAELVFRKAPDYPALAVRAHASGEVRVQAVIGADGKIKSAKALSGPAVLQRAATDAVRQWLYKPTLLDGVAVESQTDIVLTFNPK